MMSEVAERYKSYYFNHTIYLDEVFHHGVSAADLEKVVGAAVLDEFLSNGGKIEYPIYGVPAHMGSMWIEDAASPEEAAKRVEALNAEAVAFMAPYKTQIGALLASKKDDLWGPSVFRWKHSSRAISGVVDDLAFLVAEQVSTVSPNEAQTALICEHAAEMLFHHFQDNTISEDVVETISKIVTIPVRKDDYQAYRDFDNLALDAMVKSAVDNGKIDLEQVVPMTAYVMAFDRHARDDFSAPDMRNEFDQQILADFKTSFDEGLSGMKLAEAAQTEADRLASKYGYERYPNGYWGVQGA